MGESDNAGKAGLIISSGAAIGLIALALKAKPAGAAGTVTLDDATIQLLQAIAAASGVIITDLEAILAKLQTGGGISGYPVANAVTMRSIQITINVVNIAVRLPSVTAPDDMQIVIKADPGNAAPPAVVRVADSRENATDPINSYPLIQNEFRAVRIKDASNLWVSATALPAAVIISAEQR